MMAERLPVLSSPPFEKTTFSQRAAAEQKARDEQQLIDDAIDFVDCNNVYALSSHLALYPYLASSYVDPITSETLLHRSCRLGLVDLSQLLLDFGCDVNHRSNPPHLESAFHMACASNNSPIIELMLTRGAESSVINQDGNSAFQLSCLAAAGSSCLQMIALDLVNDDNVLHRNNAGQSALWLACSSGLLKVVEALLAKFAGKVSLFEKRDNKQRSLLHAACVGASEHGHDTLAVALFLIRNGVQNDVVDVFCHTPTWYLHAHPDRKRTIERAATEFFAAGGMTGLKLRRKESEIVAKAKPFSWFEDLVTVDKGGGEEGAKGVLVEGNAAEAASISASMTTTTSTSSTTRESKEIPASIQTSLLLFLQHHCEYTDSQAREIADLAAARGIHLAHSLYLSLKHDEALSKQTGGGGKFSFSLRDIGVQMEQEQLVTQKLDLCFSIHDTSVHNYYDFFECRQLGEAFPKANTMCSQLKVERHRAVIGHVRSDEELEEVTGRPYSPSKSRERPPC